MSKSTISTFQLFELIPDQETARLYLESRLWPDGVICPACKSGERITTRKDGYYRCNACKLDFTVRTGTIFERSHVPLHKLVVAFMLFQQDSDISSVRLAAEIGITQKSAWSLLRRIKDNTMLDLTLDYRSIDGFPHYRAASDGSIWSCAKGKDWTRLKSTRDKDGYRLVRLYNADGWKHCRVSVLICTAFHGPCPVGQECRHLDGSRDNNAADNLAWGTSVENKADQMRHGTKLSGDKHHNTTLPDITIAQIRAMKGQKKQREVAAQFGTTQSYVSEIWSGRKRVM